MDATNNGNDAHKTHASNSILSAARGCKILILDEDDMQEF
jgi:hypothetical protein